MDWWQLRPITGTCLCSNPDIPAGRARDAMELLWGNGIDSLRNVWFLEELMRCKDVWYNSFLCQCRNGDLSMEYYCYLLGLATFSSASECKACSADVVADPVVGHFKQSWKEAFMKGAHDMPAVASHSECEDWKRSRPKGQRTCVYWYVARTGRAAPSPVQQRAGVV